MKKLDYILSYLYPITIEMTSSFCNPIPDELETEQFLIRVRNILRVGGLVVFNKVIYSKTIKYQIQSLE